MSLTQGLQLPFGIQPVNPVPVDSWSGPYYGVSLQAAIDLANSTIPIEIRFQSMEVRLIVGGVSKKFWYRDDINDIDLIEFGLDTIGPNLSQVLAIQGRPMKLIDTSLGDYTFVVEDLAKTLCFYNTNTINAIIPDGLFNIDLGVELVGYVYGANVTIITDPNQNIDSTTIADFIMFRGSQIIQDRWLFALSSDSLGGSVDPADLNATLLVGNISNESIKLGTTSDYRLDLSKDVVSINYFGATSLQNANAFSIADVDFNNTTTLYNGQLVISHVPTDDSTILSLNQLLFQKNAIGKSLKIGETTLGPAIFELPDRDYNSGIPYILATTNDLIGLGTGNSEAISTAVIATASVIVYDYSLSSLWYHGTASSNFTANFTNLPTTDNRVLSATIVISQGVTAYIPNIVQIAGVTQSIKWAGGTQSGTANSLDLISFNFIRIGNVWTSVIGQIAPFS